MDSSSITHLTQKILTERARQRQSNPTPEAPPPPYSEDDDDMDSENEEELPVQLTLNATTSIKGSNNLIPTSPSLLQDATRFSTLLLHAVNQINAANTHANSEATESSKLRRHLRVDLTINCGVSVVGDRNVIGNVGLRPKNQATDAVAGAKRKSEDEGPVCEGPVTKKEKLDTAEE
ncbi:hypothetical protein AC578_5391 [Pseudocercospora eumusae]|uniref:Uncharacterized protein n=1 Tax=Pseudocercospora eumusae TaxID=321146 RepID=A0A139HK73_9PEZI|nr:hypothetical protein AC578_5391 [Pseudocercospora eumusae]